MTTTSTFKLLAQDCGLTMTEAADFLGVRLDTAKNWWVGRRNCPDSVLSELLTLSARQDQAAKEAFIAMAALLKKSGAPDTIELGIATDDEDAQRLGFPTAGAHGAVLRRLLLMLPKEVAAKVKIVPRGSTSATAAAADAHGK